MKFYQFELEMRCLDLLIKKEQNEIIGRLNIKFNINENFDMDSEVYLEKLILIKTKIQDMAKMIDERMIIPLFIIRGNCKRNAYDDKQNFEYHSTLARALTIMFSALSKANRSIIVPNKIEEFYEYCIYYCYFIAKFDVLRNRFNNGEEFDSSVYEEFENMSSKEAQSTDNIYTYQVQNEDLKRKLEDSSSTKDKLKDKIFKMNKYSTKAVEKYKEVLENHCYDGDYEYYIVENHRVIDCVFKRLIDEYNNVKIENVFSPENDFTFAVTHGRYTIIDYKLMYMTSDFIEKSILWGHYGKLYYGKLFTEQDKTQFTPISNKYNKLLTHYIADHLQTMKYILPYNDKKMIPAIEIKKLCKTHLPGDIDVLAYSPYTKSILNIEFKNYQMTVHNEHYFRSENNSVNNDNVFMKTKKRGEFLRENLECVCEYLGIDKNDIKVIKNMIITSRLNLSLFVQAENQKCDYYSWNDFFVAAKNKEI